MKILFFRKFQILVFHILFGLASMVQAQPLWHGTSTGMTPAEVAAVVPNVVFVDADGGRLATGAQELLRIPSFELVHRSFVVHFFFKDQSLAQVMLSLNERATFAEALSVYRDLVEVLRAKYGAELSVSEPNTSTLSANATWLDGRTNITLSLRTYGQPTAILNLNYQVRVATEADKL